MYQIMVQVYRFKGSVAESTVYWTFDEKKNI